MPLADTSIPSARRAASVRAYGTYTASAVEKLPQPAITKSLMHYLNLWRAALVRAYGVYTASAAAVCTSTEERRESFIESL
jgi:hypothetical protein